MQVFYTLLLSVLSCACEAWAVNSIVGEAAELLHRGFLIHLLDVKMSVANDSVLAEYSNNAVLSSLQWTRLVVAF